MNYEYSIQSWKKEEFASLSELESMVNTFGKNGWAIAKWTEDNTSIKIVFQRTIYEELQIMSSIEGVSNSNCLSKEDLQEVVDKAVVDTLRKAQRSGGLLR